MRHYYSKVTLVIASASGDGMQVEVQAGGPDASPLPSGFTPVVVTFRAEEEGQIRAVFDVCGELVEVSLVELERAIHTAREEVHSESYYPSPGDPDEAA